MNKFTICLLTGTAAIAAPAAAHPTDIAYPTRGACESASAQISNVEKEWLLDIGPQFFSTMGDVSSFLTRAWTCDRNLSDGQYYMTDHVQEVLDSDWFAQRKH